MKLNGAERLSSIELEIKKRKKAKFRKIFFKISSFIFIIYVFFDLIGFILFWPGRYQLEIKIDKEDSFNTQRLIREINQLEKRLLSLKPKGIYILIDSASNRLILKKGDNILREAVVSCGSGSILEEPRGKRRWVFDTPRGEFAVKSKIIDPDWIKPDWAFIEEGKEPPKDWKERVEPGVLGDYALGFGNGYFIHGTLYTRLLGRNVTHGCIRVGDEDLEVVFKNAQIGTKIYIY